MNGVLCGGVGFDSLVQRFGRDVGTVRPSNRAPLKEEPLEILAILKWLGNGAREPFGEVDRSFYAIAEYKPNSKVSSILGSNNDR